MHSQMKPAFLSVLFLIGFSTFAVSALAQKQHVNEARHALVVSLRDRRMALLEDGQVKKVYVVAVGKESTPSPIGTFSIVSRVSNPTYSHNGKVVAPGPDNPVGTRWMGLSAKGYGIHGTNAPKSIGKATSHGCIRMNKSDLEELFDVVRTGDEVRIVNAPDKQTARVLRDTDELDASPASAKTDPTLTEQTTPITTAAAVSVGQ